MSEGPKRVELLQGTLESDRYSARSTPWGRSTPTGLPRAWSRWPSTRSCSIRGRSTPRSYRLEQRGWIKGTWQKSENNREAKYYAITKPGGRALAAQTDRWRRLAGLVDKLLLGDA